MYRKLVRRTLYIIAHLIKYTRRFPIYQVLRDINYEINDHITIIYQTSRNILNGFNLCSMSLTFRSLIDRVKEIW
jgi:hypothetical protein